MNFEQDNLIKFVTCETCRIKRGMRVIAYVGEKVYIRMDHFAA